MTRRRRPKPLEPKPPMPDSVKLDLITNWRTFWIWRRNMLRAKWRRQGR